VAEGVLCGKSIIGGKYRKFFREKGDFLKKAEKWAKKGDYP
jgi:hypothetical protein